MRMTWSDLLFAHWPVNAAVLRAKIPPRLELDLFDDAAWLGIVPFRMSDTAPRGVPALPGVSAFPELNVRTYVAAEGKPGVWFFSLDAGSALAVWGARTFFHLPYFRARMRCAALASPDRIGASGGVQYESRRVHAGAPPAEFGAEYRPLAPPAPAQVGTLDYFLTERYCLYSANARGALFRCNILHAPWPLQRAEARITRNTMAQAHGIALPDAPPLLHFARELEVRAWWLEEVKQ